MALEKLVLHQTTKSLAEAYLHKPTQSLLLTGKFGSGLGTLAKSLAAALVKHATDMLLLEPDEKGTISIEGVRALYTATRAKKQAVQVVLIDAAEAMSHDAQNAFLKLLEEPQQNVYFILTSHHAEVLLATILSRVQSLEVRPISAEDSEKFLRAQAVTKPEIIQQMLFIASGRPAELSRLAHDNHYFLERAQVVRQAKEFLTKSLYEKLVLVATLSTRDKALQFVDTLGALIRFMSQKDQQFLASRDVAALEKVAVRLANNGHVRTQLTYLALHI